MRLGEKRVNLLIFFPFSRINRRRRTLAAELLILEHNFNHVEQKPDLLLRMQLARELDMSPREVQVWVSLFSFFAPSDKSC